MAERGIGNSTAIRPIASVKNDRITPTAFALAVLHQDRPTRIPRGTARRQWTLRTVEDAVIAARLSKVHDGPVEMPLYGLIHDEFQVFIGLLGDDAKAPLDPIAPRLDSDACHSHRAASSKLWTA